MRQLLVYCASWADYEIFLRTSDESALFINDSKHCDKSWHVLPLSAPNLRLTSVNIWRHRCGIYNKDWNNCTKSWWLILTVWYTLCDTYIQSTTPCSSEAVSCHMLRTLCLRLIKTHNEMAWYHLDDNIWGVEVRIYLTGTTMAHRRCSNVLFFQEKKRIRRKKKRTKLREQNKRNDIQNKGSDNKKWMKTRFEDRLHRSIDRECLMKHNKHHNPIKVTACLRMNHNDNEGPCTHTT